MRSKKAAVLPKESEGDIQAGIIKFCEKAGLAYIRNYMGPMMMRGRQFPNPNKGLPDLQVFLPDGRSTFMEVKTDDGRVSVEQKQWLQYLGDAGIPCYVIRCLESAKEILHKHLAEIAREAS